MHCFRYPLRPLTNVGRVMLCIAMSLLAAVLMLVSPPTRADDSQAVKAQSPYFVVDSTDPSVDSLPLKSNSVDVRIAGVIADVYVKQHYRTDSQRPHETRYV